MAAQVDAARPHRAGRGLARPVWTAAIVSWVVIIAIVIVGADGLGHHDVVLEESTMTWAARITAYSAAWLIMVGAMMLPTTVPMLDLFWAVSATHSRPLAVRSTFVGTYLAVWSAFGLAALAGDVGVHALVDAWAWLADRPAVVFGTTLVLAGAFQFSPLKKACLTACRSPQSMLWRHYRRGFGGTVVLGLRHALSCLGCCWALMLVMFAAGTGSLVWMLALTAVMFAEKTTPWGARLAGPVGLAFIAAGLAVLATSLLTTPL